MDGALEKPVLRGPKVQVRKHESLRQKDKEGFERIVFICIYPLYLCLQGAVRQSVFLFSPEERNNYGKNIAVNRRHKRRNQ